MLYVNDDAFVKLRRNHGELLLNYRPLVFTHVLLLLLYHQDSMLCSFCLTLAILSHDQVFSRMFLNLDLSDDTVEIRLSCGL